MKFKVGDKVRVRSWESMAKEFGVDNDGNIMLSSLHFWKKMKHLCGTVHTIDEINGYGYHFKTHFFWLTDDMLEPVKAETNGEHFRNELRELKGCVVAVVNGKPIKCGWDINCKNCLFCCKNGGCKQTKLFKKWCAEPYVDKPKPILDKDEHDYLASVIAPKKIYKHVEYIKKVKDDDKYDIFYIYVNLEPFGEIYLPCFKEEDHMYDGMEPNKKYTLKELGL